MKRKKISKKSNLTKHGVENRVAMATSDTLDKNIYGSSSAIHFSKSGKVS